MATEQTPKKEFETGLMADDLVDLTLTLCGKDDERNPRFPRNFYASYVTRIVNTALDIQEAVFLANDDRENSWRDRKRYQSRAEAKCVYLNHLIRVAWNKGWISDKQQERWQGLTSSLRWKIFNWWKSTK